MGELNVHNTVKKGVVIVNMDAIKIYLQDFQRKRL